MISKKLFFMILCFTNLNCFCSPGCIRKGSLKSEIEFSQQNKENFGVYLAKVIGYQNHKPSEDQGFNQFRPYYEKESIKIKVIKVLYGKTKKIDHYFSKIQNDLERKNIFPVGKEIIVFGFISTDKGETFIASESNCIDSLLEYDGNNVRGFLNSPNPGGGKANMEKAKQSMSLDELEEFLSKYDPIKKNKGLWNWIKNLFK